MGHLISVWSNSKKVGKTLMLYNFVREFSRVIDKDKKVLLIDLNFKYGNLLKLFNINADLHFEDVINYKLLSEGSIDYQKAIIRKENIYFLDSVMPDMTYAKTNIQKYNDTIGELKQIFDLVLVDLIAGYENPLTNLIIQNADYNINVINQDIDSLNTPFKTPNDAAYIINSYVSDVYPCEKDICNLYNIEKDIFTLPYCPLLQEMKNREIIEQYGGSTHYLNGIREIGKKFMEILNYVENKDDEKKKKKLLDFFGR